MKRSAIPIVFSLAVLVTLPTAGSAAGAQESDPWAPVRFLIGTWSGVGSGQPGGAMTGFTTFTYELDKQVIVRRNRAEHAPTAGEERGAVHEDLLIIYRRPDAPAFRGIYFDNEGHVINYVISFPAEQGSAVFDSEATDQGPRFRLVYTMAADGSLSVEFLVAPPGGELTSYAKGVLERQRVE